MTNIIRLPYESDERLLHERGLAAVKRGWIVKRHGSVEVEMGVHILRPSKALLEQVIEKEAERRWYGRPDPTEREDVTEKVWKDYKKGHLNIREHARRILHSQLVRTVGKKYDDCIKYNKDDPDVKIVFGDKNSSFMTHISDYLPSPEAQQSRVLSDEEEIEMLKERQEDEKKISIFSRAYWAERAKKSAFKRELDELREQYPLNYAIFMDTEANSVARIREIQGKFFENMYPLFDTRIFSSREENGEVRQSSILHLASPKYGIITPSTSTGSEGIENLVMKSKLLEKIFRERAEEMCSLAPWLDSNEVEADLWKDFHSGDWDLVRARTPEVVHDYLFNTAIELGVNFSRIEANPYSSIMVEGPGYRAQLRVGNYLNYLSKISPKWEDERGLSLWNLERGLPDIRTPEHAAFEEELARVWQTEFNRRNSLNLTHVLKGRSAEDTRLETVMKDLSFIEKPFVAAA